MVQGSHKHMNFIRKMKNSSHKERILSTSTTNVKSKKKKVTINKAVEQEL